MSSSKGSQSSRKKVKGSKEKTIIDELKTDIRGKFYNFQIPQPPGDPKLLDIPFDPKKYKIDLSEETASIAGSLGFEVLKTTHHRSGLAKRARLPTINMKDGLKVLTLDAYRIEDEHPELDEEDKGLLESSDTDIIKTNNSMQPSKNLKWIMNTKYMETTSTVHDSGKDSDRISSQSLSPSKSVAKQDSLDERTFAQSTTSTIEQSFEDVKRDLGASSKNAQLVESIPIFPFQKSKNSTYLQVQAGSSAVDSKEKQFEEGILRSMLIEGSGGRESIVALMMPNEANLVDEEGFHIYKWVKEFKYNVQHDIDRSKTFAFLMKDGHISYIDLNTRLNLSKFSSKDRDVQQQLQEMKQGKIRVLHSASKKQKVSN